MQQGRPSLGRLRCVWEARRRAGGHPLASVPPGAKEHAAYGIGLSMTRHPRMGAVEELKVPLREPQWNERPTAEWGENAGVYRLLRVNVNGINRLRRIGLFSVRGMATRPGAASFPFLREGCDPSSNSAHVKSPVARASVLRIRPERFPGRVRRFLPPCPNGVAPLARPASTSR